MSKKTKGLELRISRYEMESLDWTLKKGYQLLIGAGFDISKPIHREEDYEKDVVIFTQKK